MRVIANIEGEDIVEDNNKAVSWTAKAAIDGDGSGPSHSDPDYQPDTTLHVNGQPLNSDIDKYIVVPPAIVHGVEGIVLGCLGFVKNSLNNQGTYVVVGDVGPHKKLGEISIATAKALHINPSPTSGGEDRHVIQYCIWPGKPAVVDGKTYDLQAS